MNDLYGSRRERDDTFIHKLSGAVAVIGAAFKEWLTDETIEARNTADTIDARLPAGLIKNRVTDMVERLNDLMMQDINDADRHVVSRYKDMRNQAYEDPLDARMFLDEGLWRLERLARELLWMRKFADEWFIDHDDTGTDASDDSVLE